MLKFLDDIGYRPLFRFLAVFKTIHILQHNSVKNPHDTQRDSTSILGKDGPKPTSFCLFRSVYQHNDKCSTQFDNKWFAWYSNPGPQDGWHRRID